MGIRRVMRQWICLRCLRTARVLWWHRLWVHEPVVRYKDWAEFLDQWGPRFDKMQMTVNGYVMEE